MFYYKLPVNIVESVVKDLTFENPKNKMLLMHGGYISCNVSQYLGYYKTTYEKNVIGFSRGYRWFFLRGFKFSGGRCQN